MPRNLTSTKVFSAAVRALVTALQYHKRTPMRRLVVKYNYLSIGAAASRRNTSDIVAIVALLSIFSDYHSPVVRFVRFQNFNGGPSRSHHCLSSLSVQLKVNLAVMHTFISISGSKLRRRKCCGSVGIMRGPHHAHFQGNVHMRSKIPHLILVRISPSFSAFPAL